MVANLVTRNHAKGAGNNTIAGAIADILLHITRGKLRANNGSRRTGFLAGGVGAVFTHIAPHQPAVATEKGESRSRRCIWRAAVVRSVGHSSLKQWNWWWQRCFLASYLLDELHVPPGGRAQLLRIIVACTGPAGIT